MTVVLPGMRSVPERFGLPSGGPFFIRRQRAYYGRLQRPCTDQPIFDFHQGG